MGIESWSPEQGRELMIVYKPLKQIADEVKVWRIEKVKEGGHFIINISNSFSFMNQGPGLSTLKIYVLMILFLVVDNILLSAPLHVQSL